MLDALRLHLCHGVDPSFTPVRSGYVQKKAVNTIQLPAMRPFLVRLDGHPRAIALLTTRKEELLRADGPDCSKMD
jgi:hypothetical protein